MLPLPLQVPHLPLLRFVILQWPQRPYRGGTKWFVSRDLQDRRWRCFWRSPKDVGEVASIFSSTTTTKSKKKRIKLKPLSLFENQFIELLFYSYTTIFVTTCCLYYFIIKKMKACVFVL